MRLLSELRDKAGAMPTGTSIAFAAPAGGTEADAISALANLGYRRVEAHPVVVRIIERLGDDAPVGQVIRESLQELAPQ